MGGSSVPSNTTTTTVPDAMTIAGKQRWLDIFNQFQKGYTGQQYPGQRVAGFSPEWYRSRDMAERTANRLMAAGGIASIRGMDDGGTTAATPQNYTPTNLGGGNNFDTGANMTDWGTGAAYGMSNWTPGQVGTPDAYQAGTYTPSNVTQQTMSGAGVATNQIDPSATFNAAPAGYNTQQMTLDKNMLMTDPQTWLSTQGGKSMLDAYSSPYMQGVVAIAQRDAQRKADEQALANRAGAARSGAIGGYGDAVVKGMLDRDTAQLQSDIMTRGLQTAYDSALGQFNRDREALMATGRFNAEQATAIAKSNLDSRNVAEQARSQNQQASSMQDARTAAEIANQNLQARMAAERQRSEQEQAAKLSNVNNFLEAQRMAEASRQYGFTANETARQKAAELGLQTSQNNIQNAMQARQLGLNALQTGLTGAMQKANIENLAQQAGTAASKTANDLALQQQAYNQKLLDTLASAWGASTDTGVQEKLLAMLQGFLGTAPSGKSETST